jgi:RimJ/RimL family protein N-acetyltransferase
MKLVPLDSQERLQLVANWLADKDNNQWLDVAGGRRLTPEWLKIAGQRGTDFFRIFTDDDTETPIGVVGLGNINPSAGTAQIWIVLGNKAYARRGFALRAFSRMLTLGFSELGLRAINTWCVENNHSISMVYKTNFRPVGRQRQCHRIDGRTYDRLWFDILASEHKEI